MLQKPMPGHVRTKRNRWGGKMTKQELHFSIKTQKKQFQRQLRNGKHIDLPTKGNAYRKVADRNAKWNLVS